MTGLCPKRPLGGLLGRRRPRRWRPWCWTTSPMPSSPTGRCPRSCCTVLPRKTGRARSSPKRALGALRCGGPPRWRGSPYRCKRPLDLPSGTLRSSSLHAARAGWYRPRRGARTHPTSFSFRSFRFAARSPGGHGGSCFRADALVRSYPPKLRPGFPVSLTASP